MADEIDMAQGHAERYVESALRGISRSLTPDPMIPAVTECDECGAPIAAERLRVLPATRHCFECAARTERSRKLFR